MNIQSSAYSGTTRAISIGCALLWLVLVLSAGILKAESKPEYYSIQVAAFPMAQKPEALRLYRRLKQKGHLVYFQKARIDNQDWIRVRVGVFSGVSKAEAFADALRQQEGLDSYVTRADVRVDAFRPAYDLIITPSAIWLRNEDTFRELFLFDTKKIQGPAAVDRLRSILSADGGALHIEYQSQTHTIALNPNGTLPSTDASIQAQSALRTATDWLAKGDLDKAVLLFSRAIELDPNMVEAYKNRGFAFRRKGLYDNAIADYDRAASLRPMDAEIFNARGFVWYKKGAYEQALKDYDRAVAIDPQLADAYFNRGVVYYQIGKPESAIDDCSRALSIDSRHDDALSIRGLVRLQQGDLDQAIKDCSAALKINPRNIAAYSTLGVAWLEKGEIEWACSDLQKACELGHCETLNTARKKGYCRASP